MSVITVQNTSDYGYGKPGIAGSLRDAIDTAKPGDTIKFDSNLAKQTITLERSLKIDKNLTIDAQNADDLTLSGKKSGVIVEVNGENRDVTLQNLRFVDGFHKHNGAAIRVMDSNAKIRVEDSEFNNNIAGQGAAIWAKNNADVTVVDSKFDGNQATETYDSAAGAISVYRNSKLAVKGSDFTNNKGELGGAIGTIFTELTVEDSTFRKNQSRKFGGAIHNDGASVPNQSRYYSGDLPRDSQGGQTIIRDSSFIDNSAKGYGGAVSIWGYDQDFVTIEGSKFVDNEVNQDGSGNAKGGAIRVSGKLVTIKDSTITENTSAREGGGLWYQGESPVKISNTDFLTNKAKLGGGIFSHQWGGPGTNIDQSKFENNKADEGGAIYKNKPMLLDIDDSTFVNNSSKFGGNTKNITVDDASPVPQSVSTSPDNQIVIGENISDADSNSEPKSDRIIDRNQLINSVDVGDPDTNNTFDPLLGTNNNTKADRPLGNPEDTTMVGISPDNSSPDSPLLDESTVFGLLDTSMMDSHQDTLELMGQNNYSLGATTGIAQDLNPGEIMQIADSLRTSFDGMLDSLKGTSAS